MPVVKQSKNATKENSEKKAEKIEQKQNTSKTTKKTGKRGRPPIIKRGRPPKKGVKKAPYTKREVNNDDATKFNVKQDEFNKPKENIAENKSEYNNDLNLDYVNASDTKASFVAAFSYFFFFLCFIWCKDNKFVRFHANQALIMWITCFACACISIGLYYIWLPLGTIGAIITFLAIFTFLIVGISNAVSGRARPLPIIGKIVVIQ